MKRAIKYIFSFIFIAMALIYLAYIISPRSMIEIYRGADERSIWLSFKFFPFKKEISGTDTYKFDDLKWSPDNGRLAFYDYTRQEIFEKEWELKIFDPRTFRTNVVFVGDYKTSEYRWLDAENVRVYVSAGSGVRIYRDINIAIAEPFVASDNKTPEYWVPEKTF